MTGLQLGGIEPPTSRWPLKRAPLSPRPHIWAKGISFDKLRVDRTPPAVFREGDKSDGGFVVMRGAIVVAPPDGHDDFLADPLHLPLGGSPLIIP